MAGEARLLWPQRTFPIPPPSPTTPGRDPHPACRAMEPWVTLKYSAPSGSGSLGAAGLSWGGPPASEGPGPPDPSVARGSWGLQPCGRLCDLQVKSPLSKVVEGSTGRFSN